MTPQILSCVKEGVWSGNNNTRRVRSKVKIPKRKVIFTNKNFVYFKRKGKVFRARKKRSGGGGLLVCMESSFNPTVWADTIVEINSISHTLASPVAKVLMENGIKINSYKGVKHNEKVSENKRRAKERPESD